MYSAVTHKKNKIVAFAVGVSALALCLLICLLSWFAPITVLTPIFLMNTRPELRSISKNLYVGQGIQVHLSSPWIAQLGTPAWNANDFVYGMNHLSQKAKMGEEIYYPLYTENEVKEDERRGQVCVYRLSADEKEKRPYVLLLAGGGFQSVCTPMESLPVATAFNELGYTAFCLTYRVSEKFGEKPDTLTEDIARAVRFITERAEVFNVEKSDYLIGGFSAGGIAISEWCNPETGYQKYQAEKPGTACFIYGLNELDGEKIDVPAFVRYCIDDVYFKAEEFDVFVNDLSARNVPANYKKVDCLHGFGLGTGTAAEGWVKEAESFWKEQMK